MAAHITVEQARAELHRRAGTRQERAAGRREAIESGVFYLSRKQLRELAEAGGS